MSYQPLSVSKFTIYFSENVDTSSFLYSYGAGGKYNSRAEAVAAARQAGYTSFTDIVGKASVSNNSSSVEFLTNPSSLTITSPTTLIENAFLGMDGAVIRPSQLAPLKISGDGLFLADEDNSAIDGFTRLKNAQAKKIPGRILMGDLGSYLIVIEGLTASVDPRDNVIGFNFSFIETKVLNTSKTGFEYDKNRRKVNTAIAQTRYSPTPAQLAATITGNGSGDTNTGSTETTTSNNTKLVFPTIPSNPNQKISPLGTCTKNSVFKKPASSTPWLSSVL